MKIQTAPDINARHQRALRGGFTLTELMVSMAIFVLLLGGVVFANLYGLSMFRITETKLNATDDARRTVGKLANEVRTCRQVFIGNIKNGTFEGLLDGEKQQGSGLLIYPTVGTTKYVIYFVNAADKTFRRTTDDKKTVIVADYVTNTIAFRALDYKATQLTNSLNNRVIHLNLEFYKEKRRFQGADYYKLETSVTRRAE